MVLQNERVFHIVYNTTERRNRQGVLQGRECTERYKDMSIPSMCEVHRKVPYSTMKWIIGNTRTNDNTEKLTRLSAEGREFDSRKPPPFANRRGFGLVA